MEGCQKNNVVVLSDLGVMVVDEDPTSLLLISTMLKTCNYRVESFENAPDALCALWRRRSQFDLVITEIYMDAMDGFSLLQHIVGQLNIPVITMCPDDDPKLHSQALIGGACFHLVKPLNMNNMEVVWHKAWRNKGKAPANALTEMPPNNNNIMNPFGRLSNFPKLVGTSNSQVGESTSKRKKRCKNDKNPNYNADDDDDEEEEKKSRLQWDRELHRRFLVAVRLLGKQAVPAKIVDLMNVEGLTNKQISSHLQKYRNRSDKTKEDKTANISKTSSVNSKPRVTLPSSTTTIGKKNPIMNYNNKAPISVPKYPNKQGQQLDTTNGGGGRGRGGGFLYQQNSNFTKYTSNFFNLPLMPSKSTSTILENNAIGGNYDGISPFSNQIYPQQQVENNPKENFNASTPVLPAYGTTGVAATTNFVEEWPGLDAFLGIEEDQPPSNANLYNGGGEGTSGGAVDVLLEDLINFDDDAFLAEILNDIY